MKLDITKITFGFLFVATILIGIVLTIITGVNRDWYLGLLVAFVTFVSAALLVALYIVTSKFSKVISLLRKSATTIDNIAGTVGRSAPLIRNLHGLNVEEGGQLLSSPVVTSGNEDLSKKIEDIQRTLNDNRKLEEQALRQITAESRIIRMHIHPSGNAND